DAAVHHVFDGGWIWVLRFNNGVTSAGVAATEEAANRLCLAEGAAAWDRVLERLPTLREQFADAKAQFSFVHTPRLSFRSGAVVALRCSGKFFGGGASVGSAGFGQRVPTARSSVFRSAASLLLRTRIVRPGK